MKITKEQITIACETTFETMERAQESGELALSVGLLKAMVDTVHEHEYSTDQDIAVLMFIGLACVLVGEEHMPDNVVETLFDGREFLPEILGDDGLQSFLKNYEVYTGFTLNGVGFDEILAE